MAVDDTMRKLVIPPHFVPYLERHNIYELFYDLSLSLAMDRPRDHVLYLRNKLTVLTNSKGVVVRIILLGPDHIDKKEIAKEIALALGIDIISICDLIMDDPEAEQDPKRLAMRFKEYLISKKLLNKGWIIYDFPRNKHEARALQKNGINATHILQLVPSPDIYTPRDLWNEKAVEWKDEDLKKVIQEYKNNIVGLRNEVPIKGRRLQDVAKACILLTKQIKGRSAPPFLPRVVLIGPKGSYKKIIGQMLSERFNMVHVDMNELLEQSKVKNNEIGEQIKKLHKAKSRIFGQLIVALLEDRLLEHDCLNRGWVLTGFPRDRHDFEVLDSFDTHPNRVIFLTKDPFSSIERLKNRRINLFNGEIKTVDEIKAMGDDMMANHFIIHPSDEEKRLIFEQDIYTKGIKGMLDYCKNNCSIVDGSGTVEEVYDRVERVIIFPAPVEQPRIRRDKDQMLKELLGEQDESIKIEKSTDIKELQQKEKLEEIQEIQAKKFLSCDSIYPKALFNEWTGSLDIVTDVGDKEVDEPSVQDEGTYTVYEEAAEEAPEEAIEEIAEGEYYEYEEEEEEIE